MYYGKEYFEVGPYSKQQPIIIKRNYENLLKHGLKIFPEIVKRRVKVLDFGCATGVGTYWLYKRLNGVVVGIDISKYAINKAKKLFSRHNIYFHNLDLSENDSVKFLLKRYGSFDIIFSRDTLEHIPKGKQETLIRNFHLLLNNGGIIMAAIANQLNPYSYICDKTHLGLRSPWFWRKIFQRYFKIAKCFEEQWIPFLWRLRGDRKLIEIKLPLFGFIIYVFSKKGY